MCVGSMSVLGILHVCADCAAAFAVKAGVTVLRVFLRVPRPSQPFVGEDRDVSPKCNRRVMKMV